MSAIAGRLGIRWNELTARAGTMRRENVGWSRGRVSSGRRGWGRPLGSVDTRPRKNTENIPRVDNCVCVCGIFGLESERGNIKSSCSNLVVKALFEERLVDQFPERLKTISSVLIVGLQKYVRIK